MNSAPFWFPGNRYRAEIRRVRELGPETPNSSEERGRELGSLNSAPGVAIVATLRAEFALDRTQ